MDEEKLAEEQETGDVETEETTDTEEESQEDTTEVTDDSEDQEQETDDTSGESDEETDDEVEFLKQYGLPDDIDTIEKALEYAQNLKDGLLPDVKRGQTEAQKKLEAADAMLRQSGYPNGIDDIVNGVRPQGQQQTADGEAQWAYTSDIIKNNLSQGKLSQEDAAYLNSVAEIIDPVTKHRDQMMLNGFHYIMNELQALKGETTNLSSFTRNKEYADFSRLGKQQQFNVLPKDKLDAVMKEMPKLSTYQKAQAFLMATDEKELAKMFSGIKKGAETKALKKFKRTGRFAMKGKGPKGGSSINYDSFLNPDGTINQEKVLAHPNADNILKHFTK